MEKEAILELLNESPMRVAELHSAFSEMNVVNIADIFKDENKETDLRIFRLLPKSIASEVFSYIDPDEQQMLIEALSDNEVRDIMNKLFVDDAVDLIEEMPADVVKRVLQNTQNEKRKIINQMLKYPEDSAGSIMTTEYVDLSEDATVNEAFDEIRKNGINKETIYTCYVIRRDRLLVGVVSAKTLMLSKPGDRIGDIMDATFVSAHTTDDQELITQQFKKYGLLAMPVVDNENRLVGIITVDDVVQIIEEENTEDFEKMGALKPSEEPYLKTGVFTQVRNRIVWLLFLMLSATITGGIIASFEDALAVLPVLIAFIPMLMDTGGNAGSQSSTLIIRGMALGEVGFKDIAVVLWREIRIGFLCGFILGFINFIRIYLTNGKNSLLAVTVTLSLMLTLMIAKSLGCFLPMVAKKLKVDPAIMAAPLITTIVDGASLWIYFVIAKMMFKL
ncbi:magnesium transporter [Treponema primitia]|uniref:magnesium transporter n=1 Tax=Treponema primitia TaxID=88058 RepID=UPI0002555645|nr:magnesium transporter [Treponema primitia]